MPYNPLPPDPEQPAAKPDHTLEDLAALTGLFNPEIIWQEEMLLDDIDEQEPPVSETPD